MASRMLISGTRTALEILNKTTKRDTVNKVIAALKHAFKTYGGSNLIYKRMVYVHTKLCDRSYEKLYVEEVAVLKSLNVEIDAYIKTLDTDTTEICSKEQSEYSDLLRLSLNENLENLNIAVGRNTAINLIESIMHLVTTYNTEESSKIHQRAKFTFDIINERSYEDLYQEELAILKVLIAELREYKEFHVSTENTENTENTVLKKSNYTLKTTYTTTILKNEEKNSANGSNRGLAVLKIVAQILGGAVLEALLQHFLGF